MNDFKPDARQKALIKRALKAHRAAQEKGQYAPRRLIERWNNEAGIERLPDSANCTDKKPPRGEGGSPE